MSYLESKGARLQGLINKLVKMEKFQEIGNIPDAILEPQTFTGPNF